MSLQAALCLDGDGDELHQAVEAKEELGSTKCSCNHFFPKLLPYV
jgi:hypothetical protein